MCYLYQSSVTYLLMMEEQVYKSSNPGSGVRVYLMLYQTSCEEHKYLAGLRREKEAFEKLIKERGVRTLLFCYNQS